MQAVFDARCTSTSICFIAFLPPILDTQAEGRNRYLAMLRSVGEGLKKHMYRWEGERKEAQRREGERVGGYDAWESADVSSGVC